MNEENEKNILTIIKIETLNDDAQQFEHVVSSSGTVINTDDR